MGTQVSCFLALINVFISPSFVQGIKWKSYIVKPKQKFFFLVKSEVKAENNQSKLQQKGLLKLVNRPRGSEPPDKITMIGGGVQARLQKSSQHCDVIRDIMLYQLSPFKPIACNLLQTHTHCHYNHMQYV